MFIRLTYRHNKRPYLFNLKLIENIYPDEKEGTFINYGRDKDWFHVTESYEEIEEALTLAGLMIKTKGTSNAPA